MTKNDCRSSKLTSGIACCCAGVLVFSGSVKAEQKSGEPLLVELFTSQNCSACPPANEKLIELSETKNIFPLTYSVAYWDYLGWQDTFAKPEFSDRQRAYRDSLGLRSLYTPQTVLDGCVETSGKKSREEVMRNVVHAREPHGHEVNLQVAPGRVDISEVTDVPLSDVMLVGYLPGITTVVPAGGRNANMVLSHINMVTDVQLLGQWDGSEPAHFEVQCPSEACVVIVQETTSRDVMDFKKLPEDMQTDMRPVHP